MLGHDPDAVIEESDSSDPNGEESSEEKGGLSRSGSRGGFDDDSAMESSFGVSQRSDRSRYSSRTPRRHHPEDSERSDEEAGAQEQWNGFWDDIFAVGTQPLLPPRFARERARATEEGSGGAAAPGNSTARASTTTVSMATGTVAASARASAHAAPTDAAAHASDALVANEVRDLNY